MSNAVARSGLRQAPRSDATLDGCMSFTNFTTGDSHSFGGSDNQIVMHGVSHHRLFINKSHAITSFTIDIRKLSTYYATHAIESHTI
jgi:hypothetical protein